MLYPSTIAWLDVLMAKRTPVGRGWRLGSEAFLHFSVVVELSCWNSLLALRTTLVVFMLLTLTKQMVIKIADFDCLVALWA